MYRAEVFADKAKRADRSGKAKAAVCQISVDEATWVAMSKVLLLRPFRPFLQTVLDLDTQRRYDQLESNQ